MSELAKKNKIEAKKSTSTKNEEQEDNRQDKAQDNKTAEEEQAGKKIKPVSTGKFLIVCAIIVLLCLAVFFIPNYIKKINFNKDKYNSFEFVKSEDNFWYTKVQIGDQPYWIPFYYHPSELENIPVEAGLRGKFFDMKANNGSIIITLDPDSTDNKIVIAGVEISRITGSRYSLLNVPTSSGFIKPPKNSSVETGTPIITCKNSNNRTMVIWLTLSDKNIAYSYDNCLILEAKTYEDTIKVADRLMYHVLGIMS